MTFPRLARIERSALRSVRVLLPAGLLLSGVFGELLAGASAETLLHPSAVPPYGLEVREKVQPFLLMPQTSGAGLPGLLSATGTFSDVARLRTANGLIPYDVNTPFWSDGAVKTRWLAVPGSGSDSDAWIGFASQGEWTFPNGTVFVKHFELATDYRNPERARRRLETRILVRDGNGAVYGASYKWRADNTDADLVSFSQEESIVITNADSSVRTQIWYYPSPASCLLCHSTAANYVLGVKARQLNKNFTYPSTGRTDNQLRTLNHLGLFQPPLEEAGIADYPRLSPLTDSSASLETRARSYLDANCAQCHRPGGPGPSFDARWDTPLIEQNLINRPVARGDLGIDNPKIVVPKDIWRSILFRRIDSTARFDAMPPLGRNLIDTNALLTIAAWINELDGIPALPPPTVQPPGGTFADPVTVTVSSSTQASIFFTIDGTLPTTNSFLYTGPFRLANPAELSAIAVAGGYVNSVAAKATFGVAPLIFLTPAGYGAGGAFGIRAEGTLAQAYVQEASIDLTHWSPIGTNLFGSVTNLVLDGESPGHPRRFYRAKALP